MAGNRTTRLLWVLWIAQLALFLAVWLQPVSSRMTRAGGLALFCVVWCGLVGLCWRRRPLRVALLAVTVASGGFLALPARELPKADALRADYVAALRRYEGVAYVWGGESPRGIDCSGLVRRGLIDALLHRGLRTLDGGLVRRALVLWWYDTSAAALGREHDGLTARLLEAPSINALDAARLAVGDLAVTRDGVHVLAYIGDGRWIEADPDLHRVVTLAAPVPDNAWFDTPVSLVRWTLLR